MPVDMDDITKPANSDPIGSPDNGIQVEMRALKARVKTDREDFEARIAALEAEIATVSNAGITGEIRFIGHNGIPSGWLACDGSAISRVTYAALFNAIGVTFGAGDLVNTFNVPDFRGRSPLGAGPGTGLTNRNVGEQVGAETHALAEDEGPKHYHLMYGPNSLDFVPQGAAEAVPGNTYSGGTDDDATWQYPTFSAGGNAASGSDMTGNGAGDPHNNMQPSLVTYVMIKI